MSIPASKTSYFNSLGANLHDRDDQPKYVLVRAHVEHVALRGSGKGVGRRQGWQGTGASIKDLGKSCSQNSCLLTSRAGATAWTTKTTSLEAVSATWRASTDRGWRTAFLVPRTAISLNSGNSWPCILIEKLFFCNVAQFMTRKNFSSKGASTMGNVAQTGTTSKRVLLIYRFRSFIYSLHLNTILANCCFVFLTIFCRYWKRT